SGPGPPVMPGNRHNMAGIWPFPPSRDQTAATGCKPGAAITDPTAKRILLLTALFPPDVGGTPVLFEAIYSRLRDTGVLVVTDGPADPANPAAGARDDGLLQVRLPLTTAHWGILQPAGLWHHVRVAREIRKWGSRAEVIVHCARALP